MAQLFDLAGSSVDGSGCGVRRFIDLMKVASFKLSPWAWANQASEWQVRSERALDQHTSLRLAEAASPSSQMFSPD